MVTIAQNDSLRAFAGQDGHIHLNDDRLFQVRDTLDLKTWGDTGLGVLAFFGWLISWATASLQNYVYAQLVQNALTEISEKANEVGNGMTLKDRTVTLSWDSALETTVQKVGGLRQDHFSTFRSFEKRAATTEAFQTCPFPTTYKVQLLQDVYAQTTSALKGNFDWDDLDRQLDEELGRRLENIQSLPDTFYLPYLPDGGQELVRDVLRLVDGISPTDYESLSLGKMSLSQEQLVAFNDKMSQRVKNLEPLLPYLDRVAFQDIPYEFRLGWKDSKLLVDANTDEGLKNFVVKMWLPNDPEEREWVSMTEIMGDRAIPYVKSWIKENRPDVARFVLNDFSISYTKPGNERRAHFSQEMRNQLTSAWRKEWLEKHFVPWYEENVGPADPAVINRMSLDAPNWPLAFYSPVGVIIHPEFTGHHFDETMHSLHQTYRFNVRHA